MIVFVLYYHLLTPLVSNVFYTIKLVRFSWAFPGKELTLIKQWYIRNNYSQI